ncbi:MAG: hypothetical protein HY940_02845 [Gammaproteobacteria bacterium]|nr:hypothetical protein [Gammaproteobacteria bacterium]
MNTSTSRKDSDNSRLWSSAVVAAILSAGIVGTVNWYINKNEVSVKYVEIAAGILSTKSQESDKDLREWAINVINENAPFSLEITGDLRSRLINGETSFSGIVSFTEDDDTASVSGTVK